MVMINLVLILLVGGLVAQFSERFGGNVPARWLWRLFLSICCIC